MARLVPTGLIAAFSVFANVALAADLSDSPWRALDKAPAVRNFEISRDHSSTRWERSGELRIIAGRQVAPNGVIRFGIFGLKPASSLLAPVTGNELAIRKQRKAGIGFSLRF